MEKSNDSGVQELLRLLSLTINQIQNLGNNLDSPKSCITFTGVMIEYTNMQFLACKKCHVNISINSNHTLSHPLPWITWITKLFSFQ